MLLLVIIAQRNQRYMMLCRMMRKRRKNKQMHNNEQTEGKTAMIELAKRFIGKECIIYSFNGNQIECTVKEVTDGGILVERNDSLEAINFDFIMRIREYPRKKNGKKKSVVID